MNYSIIWSKKAIDDLKKLEIHIAKRIYEKVSLIEESPFRYLQKLCGSPCFRMRVGDYRIIVKIDYETASIHIDRVGHRKNIYTQI